MKKEIPQWTKEQKEMFLIGKVAQNFAEYYYYEIKEQGGYIIMDLMDGKSSLLLDQFTTLASLETVLDQIEDEMYRNDGEENDSAPKD